MGRKLECEVDVEGALDMMDRGEERDSRDEWMIQRAKGTAINRRRSYARHEATAQWMAEACCPIPDIVLITCLINSLSVLSKKFNIST
jgi:hypothetical protein